MNVRPINRPLADEHVIGTDPPLRPELGAVWRRRINPFTGRALSDRALTAEQDARAGMQRLFGMGVSAGIVSGLDLLLEPGAVGAAPDAAMIQLLPGYGLTRSGEDVTISSARRLALGRLPVFARADQLDAIASGAPPSEAAPEAGAGVGLRPLLPRRAGPPLGDLLAAPAATDLPRVAVLVAEPVTATLLAGARDECPPDPRNDPYDDLQRIEGVRLALYFWPSEQLSAGNAPDYTQPGPGPERRNRLAYGLFAVERDFGIDDSHPWERLGTPIALIGFNADWTLDFVDRAAVVRLGGQPRARTPLVGRSGSPLLWQARVAQFAEHLADLPDTGAAALAGAVRQLPPVGFLPVDLIDLRMRRQEFFPAGFAVSAVPAPLEHLDLAVRDSASLSPINLSVPDRIELIVPVPEQVYEPGLLETAVLDPAFARANARFVADRSNWLARREQVRRRRDLLADALTGTRPAYPVTDLPEALPYPSDRAPVSATRVRRVEAGEQLRVQQLLGAGSSLMLANGGQIAIWVRIADAAGLTGFSLRVATGTGGTNPIFAAGVFWGAPNMLPLSAIDGNIGLRRQGELPPADIWTRLTVPCAARWTAAGGGVEGLAIDGIEFAQQGGTIEWGPVSHVAADGKETIWIADDAPPGSTLRDSGRQTGWANIRSGIELVPAEADFGTVEADGVRGSIALANFRSRWTQGFLALDFIDLTEGGIDGFIAGVEKRLKITNDAIDLGFVRARSDIYRVRQFMLGGDAASRLVTSPALADVALRDESARAKSEDLTSFLKTAYQTDSDRDPDEPLETRPRRRPGEATPTPTPAPPIIGRASTGTSMFLNGIALARFSTLNSATTVGRQAAGLRADTTARVIAQPIIQPSPIFAQPIATRIGGAVSPIIQFQPIATIADFGRNSFTADFANRRYSGRDIQGQLALPGAVERTVTVAERLRPAPAVEAHGYAVAGKYAAVNAIAGLLGNLLAGERPNGIALGDLPAPGFAFNPQAVPAPPTTPPTLSDVILDRPAAGAARRTIDLDERRETDQRHEADYFTGAVRAIDNTVALMRLVEGRVDLYNKLVADAQAVREELLDQIDATGARLRVIGVELEEARHDVSVAAALTAEEQDRIDALNAKRRAILDTHAKMLVFRRPRAADVARAVPIAPSTPAFAEAPSAICLRDHHDVPEELQEFANLFREAAVQWFPAVRARLDLIDRLDSARTTLVAARLRAANPVQLQIAQVAAPKLVAAVRRGVTAQRAAFDTRRIAATQIDLGGAVAAELSSARLVLAERASLADLIEASHNRAQLARLAAAEVEGIAQVAACLHASFGEVPGLVRLDWAELLSEYDDTADLSRLSRLAGWTELPLALRREQQGFVDWLFARVDPSIAAARAAMSELVRIALLLAAHAPVDRLIPARLIAPGPARLGGRLDLRADISLVRIGMTALVRDRDDRPVAEAIVNDLADGIAQTRIVKLFGAAQTIAADTRIELTTRRR